MLEFYHAVINRELDTDREVVWRLGMRPKAEDVQKWVQEGKLSYQKVAEVDTPDIWQGFTLTNSINSDWWDNPPAGVRLFNGDKHRSTSSGDIVVLPDGTARLFNGMAAVAITGWKK